MSGVTPRDVVRQLVQSGGISILIKVANGVLAYAMLLAIARVTTTDQYGIFAVAFSIAMSTSAIAALGQPWAVTRFWPQWTGQNEHLRARAGLKFSLILSAVGLGAAALVMLFGGVLGQIVDTPWSFNIAAATALFMLAQGWAEFSSAGLRAQGFIIIALAPRDVAWRVGV
jgi:O-antigen/teichoic acid export membrane protein